jgi:hypothetical protein
VLAERFCRSFKKSVISHNRERYWSLNLLGASLAGRSEAESLLVSGYRGMMLREAAVPLEDRLVLTQAGELIAQLYKLWEKPEKAAEWRERLQTK